MPQPRKPKKTEYLNRSQGWLGAIRINRKGDEEAIAIPPGERIFLTDEEVELTTNSHRRAVDSPFVKREMVWHYPPTGEVALTLEAAPLTPMSELRELYPDGELPETRAVREIQEREAQLQAATT